MAKRVSVYQSVTTVHTCRLYSDDVRALFDLPSIKGKILEATLNGNCVNITFSVERHRYINHKLGK